MDTTFISMSTNRRNRDPHLGLHLSIASSQAKYNLGKNTKVLQGTKGMQTQAQVPATMDYSSLALNFSYAFNVSKGFLI